MEQDKRKAKEPNDLMAAIAVVIIFFITIIAAYFLASYWGSVVDNSVSNAGTPADTSITERMIAELDDPYLIRDGNSLILIKPVPTGVLIYRDRSDPVGELDHVTMGSVNKETGDLEIQGGERELPPNDPMRVNLEAYRDSLDLKVH